MAHYKHILLAADLSSAAEKVNKIAADLAQRNHAKLSIIHVIEQPPVVYAGGEYTVPLDANLEEMLRNDAQKLLVNLAQKLGVPEQHRHLRIGSPKKEIIDLADTIGADLIVMGNRGSGGLQHLLGSTTNAVLHLAKCDVFSVCLTKK
jgi:universal stress protein A